MEGVMRVKVLVPIAALTLVLGSGEEVGAAQCPAECRREISDVMCRIETITVDGDISSVARYYWSS
jgi:hypothetical protein